MCNPEPFVFIKGNLERKRISYIPINLNLLISLVMFCYKSYRFTYSLLILFSFCLLACTDDELEEEMDSGSVVAHDIYLTKVKERFDEGGNIYVEAGFGTGQIDTIAEYGFIFTDGLNDEEGVDIYRDPVKDVDHTVSSNNLAFSEERNQYIFDALINPERFSSLDGSNQAVVNVIAYLITSKGDIYFTEKESIAAAKVYIKDLYPTFATPGTLVKGSLNRRTESDSMFSQSLYNSTGYPLSLLIGDKIVPLENTEDYNFTFRMPEGVSTETPLILKVGDYEVGYEQKIKSTNHNFVFVTELKREFSYKTLLFGAHEALYFGGGTDGNSNSLTDFWKFDFTTSEWSQVADYPSNGIGRGITFTINNKGYCGTPAYLDSYNPATDAWARVAKPTNSLQYDHTFGPAASVVFNGKAYFTNFDPEMEAGVYYHNFHEFDPETETYQALPAYPGEDLYSDYMDKAAVHEGKLHFFPGLQHWTYDVDSRNWAQLSDVSGSGEYLKAFSYRDGLYAIRAYKKEDGYGNLKTSLSLLKYDSGNDSWERESDIPVPSGMRDVYTVETSPGNIFLCMTASSDSRIIAYKLI